MKKELNNMGPFQHLTLLLRPRQPPDTRFKPGISGNPQAGQKAAATLLPVFALETLREKVVINEQGQRKTITKLGEAAVKAIRKPEKRSIR